MTLYSMCLNILAKESNIEIYKNKLEFIPINIKNSILILLCKRGLIKDSLVFSNLLSSRITVIDLSECLVSNDILSCLKKCKFLEELNLSLGRKQTRSITTKGLKDLFQYLKFLRLLNLPHCKEINDEVIEVLSINSQLLKELYIPNSSLSDHSLCVMSQNFKYLSVLDISGNKISDSGVLHLVNGDLNKSILELSIKNTNISANAILVIKEKLTSLKILEIGPLKRNEIINWTSSDFPSNIKQIFWTV